VEPRRRGLPAGQEVRGKVQSITDYGAVHRARAGVEGLIHVSEMSWTKRSSTRAMCSRSAKRRVPGARGGRRASASASAEAARAGSLVALTESTSRVTRISGKVRSITITASSSASKTA